MSRIYKAEAVLSAKDAMSPGLRSAAQKLQRFQQQVERANRLTARAAPAAQAAKTMERAQARMGAMAVAGRLAGPLAAVGGAAAIAKSAKQYGEWDERLRRFQNTAEVTKEQLGTLEAQVRKTGHAVGLSAEDVFGGPEKLLAGGMSFDEALKNTDTIARVAKAYAASTDEIGASTLSLGNNLKIGSGELPMAFDHLAKATKLGSIEFNTFAKWLPALSGRMQSLGITGMGAVDTLGALAQAAGKTAANDDEAMNNLVNFVDKLSAPDTRKNLAKMGVNLEAVYKKSKKNGTDFVQDMIGVLAKLTKGDAFKMAEIFGDRQARDAALALIQNLQEVKGNLAAMRNAAGTVQKDLENVLDGPKAKVAQLSSAWDNLVMNLAKTVAPGSLPILDALNKTFERLEQGDNFFQRLFTRLEAYEKEKNGGKEVEFGQDLKAQWKWLQENVIPYIPVVAAYNAADQWAGATGEEAAWRGQSDAVAERTKHEDGILARAEALRRRNASFGPGKVVFDETTGRHMSHDAADEELAKAENDAGRVLLARRMREESVRRAQTEIDRVQAAILTRTGLDPSATGPQQQQDVGPGLLNFGFGPHGTGGRAAAPGQGGDIIARLEGQAMVHNTVEVKLDSPMLRAEIRSVVKEEVGPIRTQSSGGVGGLNTGRSMPEAGG